MTIVAQAFLLAYAFRRALAAAAACSLFVIFFPLEIGTFTWPSTEHFANLFVTGCLVIALAVTRAKNFSTVQCVAAGALAIAAFHVRQNTVLCGLLPLLAVMLADRSWRDRIAAVAWMVAGGMAAWGVVIGIVLWLGDLHGYFWALFIYPRIFASQGKQEDMFQLVQFFAGTTLPLIVALFGLLAAHGRYLPLTVAAIAVGVGGCLLTFHNHSHYLVNVLPYVALLIGLGTQRLARFRRGPSLVVRGRDGNPLAPLGRWSRANRNGRTDAPAICPNRGRDGSPGSGRRHAMGVRTVAVRGDSVTSRLPAANALCWTFQMQSPWKDLLPKPCGERSRPNIWIIRPTYWSSKRASPRRRWPRQAPKWRPSTCNCSGCYRAHHRYRSAERRRICDPIAQSL